MQIAVFTIPAKFPAAAVAELNQFLQQHRVVSVQKQLVTIEGESFWTCWVEYMPKGVPGQALRSSGFSEKVDYREKLSPEDFKIFSRLREYRKGFAEKEGVPLYAVFSNKQLAEMARRKPGSAAQLNEIDGIGDARVAKHFGAIALVLSELQNPVPG